MTKRVFYIIAIALLIVLGLSSRKVTFLQDEIGDGLWSMALFCFLRFIFVNRKLKDIAIATLILSYLVEFSQLIRWEWLVAIRSTFIGHMLLGQGFVWWDLLAYSIGVIVIYLAARVLHLAYSK
jgi:hypothetical protein